MAAGRAESVIQFAISLVPRTDELDRVRELARTADADALDFVGIQEQPYIERTITRGSEAYGTFTLVIGPLSWFLLFAHMLLLRAEVNVGLRRRRGPARSPASWEPPTGPRSSGPRKRCGKRSSSA